MIDVEEFERKLPVIQERSAERHSAEQAQKKSTPEGTIRQGERNSTLTSLAGSMRRRGMSEYAIFAALLEENHRRCNPPLEDAEVKQIASSVAKYTPSNDENADITGEKGKPKSQATRLVDLAEEAELVHNVEGDAYATIAIDDHYETWPIRSKWFRRWLIGQFWKIFRKAPSSQATQDALRVLTSKAIYDGPEESVSVRLAKYNDAAWLDLGNSEWQAVKITQDHWEVVPKPPVKFLRSRGLLQLPRPIPGGNVNLLRQFINLNSEDDWALLVSWIVATLSPKGPYPVLVISGEQGSAKSTLCRLLRAIIDPNSASLRATPRDGRDLVIAASNSWILAYDNISYVPPWLSDAFCRISTGGGFATRELYSDNEEVIFDVMRPIILNGICELATRSDLLDRSICITLPTIPEDRRMTEKELWSQFNQQLPQILGAFLDTVVGAMRTLPSVKPQSLPRMADFATLAVAAEKGLGLAPGTFLSAYAGNRSQASDLAIEASAIGDGIMRLIDDRNSWEGTARELLGELDNDHYPERTKSRQDWPRTPQALGKALRRIAPNLRQLGIDVRFNRGKGKVRRRIIAIEKLRILSSEMSDTSESTLDSPPLRVLSDSSDMSDKKIEYYSKGITDS